MIFLVFLIAQTLFSEYFPDCGNDWILVIRFIIAIKAALCIIVVTTSLLEWICYFLMVGFQASKNVSELSVLKNEYNRRERKVYLVYRILISIVSITLIGIYPLFYFTIENPLKKDFIAYRYFRLTQLVWYSILFFVVIIVVFMLLRKLKQCQYLYYKDHKVKFRIQGLGMLTFIIMNLVHVVIKLNDSLKEGNDEYWWINKSTEPGWEVVSYEILEIISCGIIVASKTDEDFFDKFNRNKNILRYSIF